MPKRFPFFFSAVVLVLALAAGIVWYQRAEAPEPGPSGSEPAGFKDLSSREFQDRLAGKAGDFTLINVHIPYEGQIPGNQLSIPYDRIEEEAPRALPDRGAAIYLYCMSGRMSEIAARDLVELGYRKVFNLKGGMLAWDREGFPLEDWKR